ncbi:MAG TPA: hypothetical protein VK689_20910 [Armatimonadota bacterium]|nr:hypothetical protein [Armatimonadota bacterium]
MRLTTSPCAGGRGVSTEAPVQVPAEVRALLSAGERGGSGGECRCLGAGGPERRGGAGWAGGGSSPPGKGIEEERWHSLPPTQVNPRHAPAAAWVTPPEPDFPARAELVLAREKSCARLGSPPQIGVFSA